MSALKKIYEASGEATTTVDTTYVTVATITLSEDCSFLCEGWIVGRKVSDGNMASANFYHRGKRSSSVLFVGNVIHTIPFASGSNSDYNAAIVRFVSSGSDITLQVRPGISSETEWYGGFRLICN